LLPAAMTLASRQARGLTPSCGPLLANRPGIGGRVQRAASDVFFRSVISIEPGLWVMQIGGLACSITTWGVTPQAQNTGSSPSAMMAGSPRSGLLISLMPMEPGGEACGDLHRPDGIGRREWPHRHHHLALEAPGRHAVDAGAVHGHGGVVLDVAQAQARLQQRELEGERAAQHERHEIVRPVLADVGQLLDQLAVPEDAVARHVGADVDVAEARQRGVARGAHADDRAGLGVALAEGSEFQCHILGQDAQIALHVVGRHACGMAGVVAGPDDAPCLGGVVDAHHGVAGSGDDLLHGVLPKDVR
jgi:hypothetical protein